MLFSTAICLRIDDRSVVTNFKMKQVKMETSNDNNNKDKKEAKLWKQKTEFEKKIKEKEESLDFAILHSNYCDHIKFTKPDYVGKYNGRFKDPYNQRRKYNNLLTRYNTVMTKLGLPTRLRNNGANPCSTEYSTVASTAKDSSAAPPIAPSKRSTPPPSIATDISTGAAASILVSYQPSKKLRTSSDIATVTLTAKATSDSPPMIPSKETSTTEPSTTEPSITETSATEPSTTDPSATELSTAPSPVTSTAIDISDNPQMVPSRETSTTETSTSKTSTTEPSTTQTCATEPSTAHSTVTSTTKATSDNGKIVPSRETSTTEILATEPSTTETSARETEHSTTENSATEHPTAETSATEHSTTEPSTTQSSITHEPTTVQSSTTDEPSTTEPSTTQSFTTHEHSTTQSSTTYEPSTTQSSKTEPSTTQSSMLDQIKMLKLNNQRLLNQCLSEKRDAKVVRNHLKLRLKNSKISQNEMAESYKDMVETVHDLLDEISNKDKEVKNLREIIKNFKDGHDKMMTSKYQILEDGSIGIINEDSREILYSTLDASFHLVDTPSLPDLPHTGNCIWTYDEKSRVLLAKFQEQTINAEDEKFLLQMMERDDVTVVSEGLASGLNKEMWNDEFLDKCLRFEVASLPSDMDEVSKDIQIPTMTLKINEPGRKCIYSVNTINNTVLYSANINLDDLLPHMKDDFVNNFKLPGLFIGGSNCMLNTVRTDMYLYLVT